ncbi:MAG: hypothetical protein ACM3OO_10150 [Planctomycetaceae bacterium]
MAISPSGAGPRRWPFFNAWRSTRSDEVYLVERQRAGVDRWDPEGWFRSRREADHAARDLARLEPTREFRVRAGLRPE